MARSSRYKGLTGWLDWIVDVMAVLACLTTCLLVILVCWDVLARFVRAVEAGWIFYTIEYLVYLLAFFGSPWVLRDQGHIVVDLLTQTFSPRLKRMSEIVTSVTGAIVCALVGYYLALEWLGALMEDRKVREHQMFPDWFREWIVLAPGPFVFLILTLLFLRMIVVPPPPPVGLGVSDDGV